MQACCVKCRTKKKMKDAKAITMKNGKPVTQGVCRTCGTKMITILMSTPCQGRMAFHLPVGVIGYAPL
jgi:hypothetical protein